MRIAYLEDDLDQSAVVKNWLESAGHVVMHFSSSKDFLKSIGRDSYDLMILDWLLPGVSGIEVMTHVRTTLKTYTPILFVTQKDQEKDVVEALEKGADDFMAKPLRKLELLARVTAVTRRVLGMNEDQLPEASPYEFRGDSTTVVLGDEAIELTHREYDLARFLFSRAGRVVSRAHILQSIWGFTTMDMNTRTVDTHVSRLRKKLKIGQDNGWQLNAIYQHGYRLEKNDDSELHAKA
ncbi:MAG: response regulator transcription factor [Gammaproteobacteria bacterium]|nr:response regulator transcription factor [Gammaproteobacteria bacterium]NNC96955.1 response regulator transcription factor [Gammaproteobacteria bacterium]NNM14575.1 response regulator transcription factor [Gammaproteobacteria bacterium]